MIWLVFYKIPDQFGLISKTKDTLSISLGRKTSIDSEQMVENIISMAREEDFIA